MSHAEPAVIHSDEFAADQFAWGTLQWLCNAALMPGALQTVGVSHIFPGQRNPLHYHPNCEEVLYVMAGTGRHSLDGEWFDLRPGSLIRIPIGAKHNLVNTGTESLICLVAFSSGTRETVFLEPGA
jgi:quercetin dioxygenase-like cupin family protein